METKNLYHMNWGQIKKKYQLNMNVQIIVSFDRKKVGMEGFWLQPNIKETNFLWLSLEG